MCANGRWSRAAETVCGVFQVVSLVSIALLITAALRVLTDPGSIIAEHGQPVSVDLWGFSVALGDMSLYSPTGAASVPGVIVYLLIGCVRSGMEFLAFGDMRQVIGLSRSRSPFTRECVERLRHGGGLFLSSVGLQLAYGLISMAFAFGQLSLAADLRFDRIITGVILLCVSEIFSQGVSMQDDVDGLV